MTTTQNFTVTELAALSTITGNEILYIVSNGIDYQVTVNQLSEAVSEEANLALAEGGLLDTVTSAGTAVTLNLNYETRYAAFSLTLNEPNCAISFENSSFPAGYIRRFTIFLTQGTGSNLVTWPSSIVWNQNDVPVLSITDGYQDIFEFVSIDAGASYLGFFVGTRVAT